MVGASAICFARRAITPGLPERAWAGASLRMPGASPQIHVAAGSTTQPYQRGLLALREGPLREAALRGLPRLPDVLIVDATGRDHPRRAGLALHLGAVLGIASLGVTDRPLLAQGAPAQLPDRRGAVAPLRLGGEIVACWVRTRPAVRPVVVHPGWGLSLDQTVELVLRAARKARTPQSLRIARRAARVARSRAGG
ncbi:MAG: endonuclease V [Nitriliruptorales bacterium]|nr:endonuclease V [Nitriliruptorales bacterium]